MTYSATEQTWISTDDVSAATKLDLSTEQVEQAEVLVGRYAGELCAQLSRTPLIEVTDELAEVVGDLVVTRHRPVIVATAVQGRTSWDTSTGNIRLTGVLPRNGTKLLVSYEAGFSGYILDALRSVVVGRVLRALLRDDSDAIAVSSVSEEGHSDAYLEDNWTPGEQATINALRRRIGAS